MKPRINSISWNGVPSYKSPSFLKYYYYPELATNKLPDSYLRKCWSHGTWFQKLDVFQQKRACQQGSTSNLRNKRRKSWSPCRNRHPVAPEWVPCIRTCASEQSCSRCTMTMRPLRGQWTHFLEQVPHAASAPIPLHAVRRDGKII